MRHTDKLQHPSILQEILRCEVGSSAHGLNLPGTDDFDMLGVAVEHPAHILGLHDFEQVIYRTAEERDGKKNTRSQAGDIDLSIYSLRKFARLAAKGNPSVLVVLFGPLIFADEYGHALRASRQLFISKEAGRRFLGYLTAQKERMTGERGQKNVRRPELVEKYGYDTKYAMHAIRLGYQGTRLLQTGEIPVPVDAEFREYLLGLRVGKVSETAALAVIEWFEEELRRELLTSSLPENVDPWPINNLLVSIYKDVWQL